MQSNPSLPDNSGVVDDGSGPIFESPLVDTIDGVQAMLRIVNPWPTPRPRRPTIFIDLEGVSLGREGHLCLLALHHTVSKRTFVIDIHRLGAAAFDEPGQAHERFSVYYLSLKEILESPTIPKGIFDVRNDSAALYHGFGIKLRNMHDVQLLEIVARPPNHQNAWKYRSGLEKAILHHSNMSGLEMASWSTIKSAGGRLFTPEKGGTYEVFRQRPLHPVLISYSVNDVIHLPCLYEKFTALLSNEVIGVVDAKTRQAILDTFSPSYQGTGAHRSLSPWS